MSQQSAASPAIHNVPQSPPHGGLRQAGIFGLGMCVPDRICTNEELSQTLDTSDDWIAARTGIRQRRLSDPQTATSDLAVVAAQRALDDAGMNATDIDLILCATASGDYLWPATACVIQARLGATRAAAFDLSAACSGFSYALTTASSFVACGMMERVLVIGADTLTKQLNWQDRGTCILFGDGAGAAVIAPCAPGEGILYSTLGADGNGLETVWIPAGGSRTPITPEVLAQKQNCIAMRGADVYRFTIKILPDAIRAALRQVDLTPCDICLLVLHQANVRIINAVAERLGVPNDRVFVNVDRYGNTSAASIPLALTEAVQSGRLNPGDLVVTVGFGSGLTWGVNIIRWNRT